MIIKVGPRVELEERIDGIYIRWDGGEFRKTTWHDMDKAEKYFRGHLGKKPINWKDYKNDGNIET